MRIQPRVLFIMGILCLRFPPPASATSLPMWVFGTGGARVGSAAHTTTCTLGQPAVGIVLGTGHAILSGFWHRSNELTGVDPSLRPPVAFDLSPIWPNPLRESGVIRYAAPGPSRISIQLYDVCGRLAARLKEGEVPAGWHQIVLDGMGLNCGVYFCRMTAPGYQATRKFVLMR